MLDSNTSVSPESKAEEHLGVVHENLEGWVPTLASVSEIHEAVEKAFDYRGDLTITLKDGQKIEGYIFDRKIKGPSLTDCFIRVMPKDRPRYRRGKKLRRLGKKIQREESRRRKKHRHRRRSSRRLILGTFRLFALMRLQLLIFLPGQINNHGIENGQRDQRPGMCAREAVQLVAHERTENDDRERIGPEFVEPESDHQERLDYSMRDEIHGREVRAAVIGHLLRGVQDVRDDPAVRRVHQQRVADPSYDLIHLRGLKEPQDHATEDFEQASNALERDTHTKRFVQN